MDWIKSFFDTAGVGGIVAGGVIVTLLTCYALAVRWISRGHED